MAYSSMSSMMQGPGGTAPVPTQSFNAANIFGTPVPAVGDSQGRPNYAAQQTQPVHIALVAVGVFAIGYLVFHLNFEK